MFEEDGLDFGWVRGDWMQYCAGGWSFIFGEPVLRSWPAPSHLQILRFLSVRHQLLSWILKTFRYASVELATQNPLYVLPQQTSEGSSLSELIGFRSAMFSMKLVLAGRQKLFYSDPLNHLPLVSHSQWKADRRLLQTVLKPYEYDIFLS